MIPVAHHLKTKAPSSHPLAVSENLQQARTALRAAGLRGTVARLAVLQRLLAAQVPQSHSDVYIALRTRGFDSATIYRNLMELTRARLLTRVDVGDHVWRFEKTPGTRTSRATHPHFVCDECGSVACLDDGDVRVSRRRRNERVAQISSITVKGRCRRC